MSDISPYLLEPPRFRETLRTPSLWRGLARARDHSDPLKAVYERIAQQLDRGTAPESIPEIAEWLQRKAIWQPKGSA
jgi:hypothetical protein